MKRQETRTTEGQITPSEMRKALLRSGYLLEQRVEDTMRERMAYVATNTAYPDEFTGKSRELDVRAMSAVKAGPGEFDFLFSVILSECQNNVQPIVFFTKEPMVASLHHYEVKLSGIPVEMLVEDVAEERFVPLSEFLQMGKYHHYCEGQIATQYCTFQPTKDRSKWIALHRDEQHDSITVLITALQAEIKEHNESWTAPHDKPEPINVQIYYPLIVLQGSLYEAFPVEGHLKLKKSNHIQFRKEYHSANRHDTCQIDVITEAFLGSYLTLVEREVGKTARLLRRRKDIVRRSIDTIVAMRKRAKGAEEIRPFMIG